MSVGAVVFPVFPPRLAGRYRGYRNRMAVCAGCKQLREFYASFDELTAPGGPICALCECRPAEKPASLRGSRRPVFFATCPVDAIDVASTARDERSAGFLSSVCSYCFPPAETPEFAGLEGCLSHSICQTHLDEQLADVRRAV